MNTESSVENTVHEYAAPQMPLKDYACLVGIFGTLLTGTLLLSRVRKTELRLTDIVLIGLATHKLSRMVAKDRVTSPFRAPFAK